MDYRQKHIAAIVFLTIGTACAIWGFNRLQGEVLAGHVTALSVILLFGGVAVGVTAGLLRLYWRSKESSGNDGRKIAIETLAKVGAPKKENKSE